jgi:pimeloyl-ACP methyl ester carboxylesterase
MRNLPQTFELRVAALERDDYDEFALLRGAALSVRREDLREHDGATLSVVVWGDATPQLVLLHGGGQNAHTWDGVGVALGRPLVAIDLPGHGHSSHRPDRDYWPWRNADVVADAIRRLADEPVVVVGMSLGGLTGIHLAASSADLVRSLVIVDVTPSVHEVEMTADQRGSSALVSADPTFDSFAELVETTAAVSGRAREDVALGARHNSYRRLDGRWTWRYDRLRTADDPPLDFSALWLDVDALTCPTMLVRGGASFHVPEEHAREFERRRPGARLEVVPAARHAVQSDKPAEVAALIEDFAFGPGSWS